MISYFVTAVYNPNPDNNDNNNNNNNYNNNNNNNHNRNRNRNRNNIMNNNRIRRPLPPSRWGEAIPGAVPINL